MWKFILYRLGSLPTKHLSHTASSHRKDLCSGGMGTRRVERGFIRLAGPVVRINNPLFKYSKKGKETVKPANAFVFWPLSSP